jgi:hypothetical protein
MKKPSRRLRQAAPPVEPTADEPRIVQHPDGYYWLADVHEVGPFSTLEEARADMEAAEAADSGIEPGETLDQAEAEIGVKSWIDQETGAPAEEGVPRVEDH